jgi:hypothetical protein
MSVEFKHGPGALERLRPTRSRLLRSVKDSQYFHFFVYFVDKRRRAEE